MDLTSSQTCGEGLHTRRVHCATSYIAWGGGKLYHQPDGKFSDPIAWDQQYSTRMGTPRPPEGKRYRHGLKGQFTNKILARLIDWAPVEATTEQTADWKTAEGAAGFLQLSFCDAVLLLA